MYKLDINSVRRAAAEAGIRLPLHAAEIIRLMTEMRSNNEILDYLHRNYGTEWRGAAQKRKFVSLVQSYIIENHYEDFVGFCRKNGIDLFNDDLEVVKGDNTYARFIYVAFLREEVGMRPPIAILV